MMGHKVPNSIATIVPFFEINYGSYIHICADYIYVDNLSKVVYLIIKYSEDYGLSFILHHSTFPSFCVYS